MIETRECFRSPWDRDHPYYFEVKKIEPSGFSGLERPYRITGRVLDEDDFCEWDEITMTVMALDEANALSVGLDFFVESMNRLRNRDYEVELLCWETSPVVTDLSDKPKSEYETWCFEAHIHITVEVEDEDWDDEPVIGNG